ncbi:thaumatin-like protein 1b [Macadamia integrifolia]|uniref:thaumatin-like protein 1b n=1 Tax=Macadamia integrifolia TaxID=60698 RepID=UPI001C4F934D|nr:thaumatin-like protein 1b [Macadamia integrifolia]
MAAIGLLTLLLALLVSGTHQATFTFKNNCGYTVWPGTLTGGGSSQLSSTGFKLSPGESSSLEAQAPWSGRFWGRTICSTTNNSFKCATADCASGDIACKGAGAIPPATLVEFTIATNGSLDFYDVSLVDGFNLPMSVTPQVGETNSTCQSASCPGDVNSICPPELSVNGANGRAMACKSACEAFQDPKYCCSGNYGSPTTCKPTNYSMIFKKQCPQAYSYAYDDKTSTFTCTGANYLITFCP